MMHSAAVSFHVVGTPVPQGSSRAFLTRSRTGPPRAIITSASKGLPLWRGLVSQAAMQVAPSPPWSGPIALDVTIRLPQPKSRSRFRGRGKERHEVPLYPDRRPDIDKLVRALLDSMTGIIFEDDAQVVRIAAVKEYGSPPGVSVTALRLPTEGVP